ncbi:hypothetical protein [Bacteriovorax sp. DB6_IX]|uniref:hypothetical protein n=1 Tax=Bacteriovorax sp. DB6_IX TaxID=1353530 RepID=UPI000389F8A1|nr:hypothetical protein [Bacteriovorax sp. DB6_IX]EQC52807.1 hypothetical protein M901_0693 [Bacteriovorax sp. DB6_IX]
MKFLLLFIVSISVFAGDDFDEIIFRAIADNPNGFFEDHSSGRKNLPINVKPSGKYDLNIKTDSSGGKNFVSGLVSSMGSLADTAKKTDFKKYGSVDFSFMDNRGNNHEVNCSIVQEYECGRISLTSCHSKSGAVVGPTGGDRNFRYIYDEVLASNEQCYPQLVHKRRLDRKEFKNKESDKKDRLSNTIEK